MRFTFFQQYYKSFVPHPYTVHAILYGVTSEKRWEFFPLHLLYSIYNSYSLQALSPLSPCEHKVIRLCADGRCAWMLCTNLMHTSDWSSCLPVYTYELLLYSGVDWKYVWYVTMFNHYKLLIFSFKKTQREFVLRHFPMLYGFKFFLIIFLFLSLTVVAIVVVVSSFIYYVCMHPYRIAHSLLFVFIINRTVWSLMGGGSLCVSVSLGEA